jgi:signal transduction histidine kinase
MKSTKKNKHIVFLIEPDMSFAEDIHKIFLDKRYASFQLKRSNTLTSGLEQLGQGRVLAVLLDPNVPECRPLAALKRLQEEKPRVPIILLVKEAEEELAGKLLRKGAQDYLTKSEMNAKSLVRVICHAVDRKKAQEALRRSEARYRRLSRNLEKSVERKAAQLQQMENMAAIGRMVSILAHEIRNPLQTISMAAENLQRALKNEGEANDLLDEINYGARLLGALVSDLVEYSRPLVLNYSHRPLRALIEQLLQTISTDYPHVSVSYSLAEPEREIAVDAAKMRLALRNIIRNAADAMSEGGTLTIRSRTVRRNGSAFVRLTIADTGGGIKRDDLQRVEEPFYTTKALGTGLGYPMAKKIVEAHKGTLKIKSKHGKGTTVEILLPVSLN